jgi:hypothetical protein
MKINHICTLLLLFSTWCHLAVAGTCSELLVSPIPKYTVTTIPGTKVRLVNLGPAVRQFVTLAKDLPYEEQEKLWLELIEKNHLYFYRHMVWGNQPGEINRKAFLESLFKNDFFAQAPASGSSTNSTSLVEGFRRPNSLVIGRQNSRTEQLMVQQLIIQKMFLLIR